MLSNLIITLFFYCDNGLKGTALICVKNCSCCSIKSISWQILTRNVNQIFYGFNQHNLVRLLNFQVHIWINNLIDPEICTLLHFLFKTYKLFTNILLFLVRKTPICGMKNDTILLRTLLGYGWCGLRQRMWTMCNFTHSFVAQFSLSNLPI